MLSLPSTTTVDQVFQSECYAKTDREDTVKPPSGFVLNVDLRFLGRSLEQEGTTEVQRFTSWAWNIKYATTVDSLSANIDGPAPENGIFAPMDMSRTERTWTGLRIWRSGK